jgi:type IV pilus assembly protein PilF
MYYVRTVIIEKMNLIYLVFVSVLVSILSACSAPIAAMGAMGNIVNRTADIDTENQQPNSQSTSSGTYLPPDREEIAATNFNLGIEYMKLGEYNLALEKLLRAKEVKPDFIPAYNALGLLHQKLERMDEAEHYFRQALKLDENEPNTLNNYGQFLCNQGRDAEAEKYFLASANNPLYEKPEIPFANIGTCAYMHGQPDKASDYFKRALIINPVIPAVLIQMTEIDYNKGDYVSAHHYLERFLKYTDHTPKSLWLGICIEQELGDKNKVSGYALLLRNQYPDSDEAQLLEESGIR